MTKLQSILTMALMLGASALAVVPSASASASSCPMPSGSQGSGSCAFMCPNTDNIVAVSASISAWVNQWRVIEGYAYCDGKLAAVCADRGDCQGTGYGKYGSGTCIIRTGQGVDFTGACSANDGAYTTIRRWVFGTSAETCDPTGCITVPVECLEGSIDVACAVGATQEELRALFPDI